MTGPQAAARAAQDSTVFRVIARIGYVVLGVVHIVIGIIAISVATGSGGGEADQGGAMESIQKAPAGVFLLWAIFLGLTALAIWQITEAFLERNPDTKKKWGYRIKYVGTAVAYIAIAITALVYALGGQSDSSESSQSFSAQLMATPAGVFVLGLVGLIVAAIGIAFIFRGITRAFKKNLILPSGAGDTGAEQTAKEGARNGIVAFGVVGYIAKGIAIGVTGILFIVAAFTHDAATAGGLDAALHSLAVLPFGPIILWIVGLGLILYGLFCFARARYAKM
jgi:membrane protease YdiL (CAAX protease family)